MRALLTNVTPACQTLRFIQYLNNVSFHDAYNSSLIPIHHCMFPQIPFDCPLVLCDFPVCCMVLYSPLESLYIVVFHFMFHCLCHLILHCGLAYIHKTSRARAIGPLHVSICQCASRVFLKLGVSFCDYQTEDKNILRSVIGVAHVLESSFSPRMAPCFNVRTQKRPPCQELKVYARCYGLAPSMLHFIFLTAWNPP